MTSGGASRDSTLIVIANALTLSRLPLGVLFWWFAGSGPAALSILFLGAFTDVVDGPIARHARSRDPRLQRSKPGVFAWADPFCDKFFVLSVLLATYVTKDVAPAMMVALAMREIVLVPLAAIYRLSKKLRARLDYDFTAGALGKATTVVQFFALAAILLDSPASKSLALAAGFVGVLAAVDYIARGIRLTRAAGSAT
ncbi:MAG TPA: CDP-alcohol phosphatidyltransferase family protein [Polyangia bacterium]